jgi:hypothetical protein
MLLRFSIFAAALGIVCASLGVAIWTHDLALGIECAGAVVPVVVFGWLTLVSRHV